jgi:hypothetical protein
MKSWSILGLALVLAVLATPGVQAFQKQDGGGATPGAQVQPGSSSPTGAAAQDPRAGIASDSAIPPSETGTEISIPGLGKLGVLPKMDFGLELLYGATDHSTTTTSPVDPEATPDDDLMIRGTVKHRF